MVAVKISAPPAQQRFVDKALHLRSAALQHRPTRRSVAAIATGRSRRRRPSAPIACTQPTASARRASVHVPRVRTTSARGAARTPTSECTCSIPVGNSAIRYRGGSKRAWSSAVHKTMLQMLSVQSMLEVFVLTVWATLTPNCSYVAFLRKLYPDVHVLTAEQIGSIKAAGVKYMVPLRLLDPAGSVPQRRVRSCRRRQGTSSSTGWCTCEVASSR